MEVSKDHLSGRALYGDDLSGAELERWYQSEERGYYNLAVDHYKLVGESYSYEYTALNKFHAFDFVLRRRWSRCLALGCAAGDDVAPLGAAVESFIAVEPAEQWWREEIGGRPATFVKPAITGDLPLDDASVDLATCIGVLHHIPNVSHVLSELARVLEPGGLLIIREPISSMGDFRTPRVGLTENERGLPATWLKQRLKQTGFRIRRWRLCMLPRAGGLSLVLRSPYNNTVAVFIDWILSTSLGWNTHYWRPTALRKLAPGSIYAIVERV